MQIRHSSVDVDHVIRDVTAAIDAAIMTSRDYFERRDVCKYMYAVL